MACVQKPRGLQSLSYKDGKKEAAYHVLESCYQIVSTAYICMAMAVCTMHDMMHRRAVLRLGWTCRMGTHPSGPATVEGAEGQTLSSWIAANPSALGSVSALFGSDIPFLFKVPILRSPSSA